MSPALLSLFLGTFSIGTAEWVIAGLVPTIAQDLNVDVPTAGLLISGYAIGVAVGGPFLSIAMSRFERKSAALLLMGIFILGQVFCAVAPTYALLMAARVFVSLAHGSFFGVAFILAASIAGKGKEGVALSFIFGGVSIANIVGVPGGTALGNWLGWRATFWAVGAIAVVATLAMTLFLPRTAAEKRTPQSLRAQIAVLRRHQVWLSYLMAFTMTISYLTIFTFVVPIAEGAGVSKDGVPLVLLLYGAGAVLGTMAGGRLTDWNLNRTLVIGFSLYFVPVVGLALFASSAVGTAVSLALIAFTGFSTTSATQSRILKGAADAPDLASSLTNSAYNFGFAGGAWIGATLVRDGLAYSQLPWVSAVFAASVAALAVLAAILDRSKPPAAVPQVRSAH